jgi:predicted metalloprotease with PDZ domain
MKQVMLFPAFSFTLTALFAFAYSAAGQHPLKNVADAVEIRYSSSQPAIRYTLRVDTTDLSAFDVEMRIRNIPDTFRVAMVMHPEYDDRFWRYVRDVRVETKKGKGNVSREDSALWRIVANGEEVLLQYSIHLPKQVEGEKPAWTAFLSATGGLVGGPHSFMYVVGAELAPVHLTVKVPGNWQIATGLEPTSDPTVFFAPSVAVLADCPLLIGKLKNWSFQVDGVPHHIVYWLSPAAQPFDATKLVAAVQKIVQQTALLFGRLPYREYTFQFIDDAYGSLEHSNSVTVGITASKLEKDLTGYLAEIAHEYFHSWNLVRIRPAEYGDVSYKQSALSKGLWFSEGLTMFYADLLLRRAGLPTEDSARVQHLERLIGRYYGNAGNRKISPEKVSMAEYGPQGMLGDYMASSHLQGELLGTMIDLIIRNATNGKYSMDDVMRKMMERFSGAKGFTGSGIEQIITATCGYNMQQFFRDHIYGNKPIEFNKYLQLAGMHCDTTWKDVLNADGKPAPDLRIYPYQLPAETAVKLAITDPSGLWGKAGLHTGDVIVTLNQSAIKNRDDFWQKIRRFQVGDTALIAVQKPAGISKKRVIVQGYKRPVASIKEKNGITQRQRKLGTAWMHPL